ncbi:MAG: hypothetical protein HC933_18655, partial [Pleurocapsa sp. SU_196_0]|nr:hypothetical protein [Pleurocapsa sp. SU_196_0]
MPQPRAALTGGLLCAITVVCVVGVAQEATPIIPKFVDETTSSGISSRYDGEWEFKLRQGV